MRGNQLDADLLVGVPDGAGNRDGRNPRRRRQGGPVAPRTLQREEARGHAARRPDVRVQRWDEGLPEGDPQSVDKVDEAVFTTPFPGVHKGALEGVFIGAFEGYVADGTVTTYRDGTRTVRGKIDVTDAIIRGAMVGTFRGKALGTATAMTIRNDARRPERTGTGVLDAEPADSASRLSLIHI